MYKETKYIVAGDKSLVVEFGNSISPGINAKIRSMVEVLDTEKIEGINEIIPTYRSILVLYDPLIIGFKELVEKLKIKENDLKDSKESEITIIELPTVYGGEYGPDIDFVAKHNNLTRDQVIDIHSSRDYLVYMLGFTPGFSYLGGMSEEIETPRLQTPRTKIPAGSTGIAGKQTGIYPIDSPGGWQLIGRTPVKLYTPLEDPPVLLNAGDYVRFVPVDEKEYLDILRKIEKDEYKINIIEGGEVREGD
ncbi:MAG: 5-oxoprolinase subunit PxpB [Tissierella sp.]|uniref:5-oxoprolinase subunit PxpB n=1 Tax=Tissierella sp. TaxID=41274 RepID=UPI003F9D869C